MGDARAAMDDIRAVQGQACREAGAQLDSATTVTGAMALDVRQVDINAACSHHRLDTRNPAFDWGVFARDLLDALPWGGQRNGG